jgi:hypothetical protein
VLLNLFHGIPSTAFPPLFKKIPAGPVIARINYRFRVLPVSFCVEARLELDQHGRRPALAENLHGPALLNVVEKGGRLVPELGECCGDHGHPRFQLLEKQKQETTYSIVSAEKPFKNFSAIFERRGEPLKFPRARPLCGRRL